MSPRDTRDALAFLEALLTVVQRADDERRKNEAHLARALAAAYYEAVSDDAAGRRAAG